VFFKDYGENNGDRPLSNNESSLLTLKGKMGECEKALEKGVPPATPIPITRFQKLKTDGNEANEEKFWIRGSD